MKIPVTIRQEASITHFRYWGGPFLLTPLSPPLFNPVIGGLGSSVSSPSGSGRSLATKRILVHFEVKKSKVFQGTGVLYCLCYKVTAPL